jgi:hypothetical protein
VNNGSISFKFLLIILVVILGLLHLIPRVISDDERLIKSLIENWRISWENKNISRYRTFYHTEFRTKDGNFSTWLNRKKKVFAKPSDISVEISDIVITIDGSDADADFVQKYHSGDYADFGRKRLSFRKTGGKWLIISEHWTPIRVAQSNKPETGRKSQINLSDIHQDFHVTTNTPWKSREQVEIIPLVSAPLRDFDSLVGRAPRHLDIVYIQCIATGDVNNRNGVIEFWIYIPPDQLNRIPKLSPAYFAVESKYSGIYRWIPIGSKMFTYTSIEKNRMHGMVGLESTTVLGTGDGPDIHTADAIRVVLLAKQYDKSSVNVRSPWFKLDRTRYVPISKTMRQSWLDMYRKDS